MPLPGLTGSATADLGLGDMLGQQTKDETEEARKKRMLQIQQERMMGPAAQSLLGAGGYGGILGR